VDVVCRATRGLPSRSRLVRAPAYRPTLVDPFLDYLRHRREQDSAVPVLQLLTEIKQLGYQGSQNLLYRYIIQGRIECATARRCHPDGSPATYSLSLTS
jgi:hypothetical protein